MLQQPLLAAALFVGLVAFWLIPPIHFRAMIDQDLFWVMNWSMVLDGLLFWCLVLDPRPRPPARLGYGLRAALAAGVIFPQILIGALIVFSGQDLYPYYTFCGRLYPSVGPMYDQFVGGFVIWVPTAMMSVIGLLLVLKSSAPARGGRRALRRPRSRPHERPRRPLDGAVASPSSRSPAGYREAALAATCAEARWSLSHQRQPSRL